MDTLKYLEDLERRREVAGARSPDRHAADGDRLAGVLAGADELLDLERLVVRRGGEGGEVSGEAASEPRTKGGAPPR